MNCKPFSIESKLVLLMQLFLEQKFVVLNKLQDSFARRWL